MSTVYVSIMEDDRAETTVAVFADVDAALRAAQVVASNLGLAAYKIHGPGTGLLYWAHGGHHDANLRVVEREVID